MQIFLGTDTNQKHRNF